MSELSDEFSAAVAEQAQLDAEIVGNWLIANLGEDVSSIPLSEEFLLGIALGLRLCRWEVSMIRIHLDNGLPSGPQIIRKVIQEWAGAELKTFILSVGIRITQISGESFLWSSGETTIPGIPLAIQSDEDDERLIESMATYLSCR